jgi:hypothetical protein
LRPGRIALFAGSGFLPWRTIRLEKVPHPTVLLKLVRELARSVEVDDENLYET